jgi:uncharacterized membrane protein YfcA
LDYLLGLIIAFAVGLTGVGGGTLTVPLLILLLAVPAPQAVGTALVFVTVIKLLAVPMYALRGQIDLRIALRMILGGVPGVIAGAILLTRMRGANLQPIVLTVVGLTVVAMAAAGLWKMIYTRRAVGDRSREKWLPWLAFPIALEVGFSSAGAGALGNLALMECTSLPTSTVVGTDLLFGVVTTAIGGGLHLMAGNVNRALLLHLSAGGIPGVFAGAWLSHWLPSPKLRAGLTAFLMILGAQIAWRGLHDLIW